MANVICTYSSSSNAIDMRFFEVAMKLGAEIGRRKSTLVYGGGEVGLMGAVASSVHKNGGKVVAVIPEVLNKPGIVYESADELIVTANLRERKMIMEERADGFVALPGGFGTLEEILEIITLKQLRYHNKPVVFLNINHFFEPLIALFEYLYQENFARQDCRGLYYIAKTIEEVFAYFDNYQPAEVQKKWI